jgi:hypothetical protein
VIDTVFLERVPDGMRGRVFGVGNAAAWIAMPPGVLIAGPAIEAFGLRATLLATGAVYAVVAALTIWAPSLADLDRPADEDAGTRADDVARAPEQATPGFGVRPSRNASTRPTDTTSPFVR